METNDNIEYVETPHGTVASVVIKNSEFKEIVRSIEPILAELGQSPDIILNSGMLVVLHGADSTFLYEKYNVNTEYPLVLTVKSFSKRMLGESFGPRGDGSFRAASESELQVLDELYYNLSIYDKLLVDRYTNLFLDRLSSNGEPVEEIRMVQLNDLCNSLKEELLEKSSPKEAIEYVDLIPDTIISSWLNNTHDSLINLDLEVYLRRLITIPVVFSSARERENYE